MFSRQQLPHIGHGDALPEQTDDAVARWQNARPVKRSFATTACLALVLVTFGSPVSASEERFDLVIRGGRVIDPLSGLDAVRNVGIRGKHIAAVTEASLDGARVLDARGLVVVPGFIDLHNHAFAPHSQELRVLDGVTTALELEGGVLSPAEWLAGHAGKSRFNFGASAGHYDARRVAIGRTLDRSIDEKTAPSEYASEPSTPEQIGIVLEELSRALDEGGIGIGYMPDYMPGTSHLEGLRVFELAAARGTMVFSHQRYGSMVPPGTWLEGVQELIADSAITGAPIHICHVTSMNLSKTPVVLDMIDAARARGVDVTTEVYPYTAWSTGLGTPLFEPGWQQRFEIDYEDLTLASTGEVLTAATFEKYRAEQQSVVGQGIPEPAIEAALRRPGVMIVSDAGDIETGNEHPRGAGTNGRILGRYVREKQVLTLTDAIARMTYLPARRLERVSEDMKRKGRVQPDADADLVMFDPATVTDRAVFGDSDQPSLGFVHVIVGGVPVVRDSRLVDGAFPGQPVRGNGVR
jgi:dihydroorotase